MSLNDLLKPFLTEYNSQNSVIMISSYPAKKDRSIKYLNAVASYADHLTPELNNSLVAKGKKLIILAEVLDGEEVYKENEVLVVRGWKRNSLFVFTQLMAVLSLFNNVSKVFLQFEFNMLGGASATGQLPLFLLTQKITGRDVTVLLHQVVENLGDLSGHIGVGKKSVKLFVLQSFLNIFYRLALITSGKIVVHDEILRTRLNRLMTTNKVYVIPHGLGEYKNTCSLFDARGKLGYSHDEFTILCFGFVTWYKGSDWVVDQVSEFIKSNPKEKVKLVIAGGESANLRTKPHYMKFYNDLKAKIDACPQITLTGFISDSDVQYYFCAADVVILPYRTQMSASGPLAVTLSFNKPFLLSDRLLGALETEDIKNAMKDLNMGTEEVSFSLEGSDFFEKIKALKSNESYLNVLSDLSSLVREQRDWTVVSKKFLEVIEK